MSQLWRSVRAFYYSFHKIQTKLLPPVVVLFLVFIIIRWASKPQGHVWELEEPAIKFTRLNDEEINLYLDALEDARSEECKSKVFTGAGKHEVSIILDFSEHQFYDLQMTLESIIRHTPDDLYKEILILDDGTIETGIRKDALRFLGDNKYKKVRAFRSDKAEGTSLSRFKASKLATGSILAFVSSEVAVNVGWLEPLITAIKEQRTVIAVSHADSLLSNHRFFRTPDNLVNIFDWTLSTLFYESKEEGDLLESAAMTGAAFAVEASFFSNMGAFDESMDNGGGENLELSIRAWLCGGAVKISTCSRVAVKNALKPVRITSGRNFRRIAELWLEHYRTIAFRQSDHSMELSELEQQQLSTRRLFLKKSVTCDPFQKYLKGPARAVLLPPDDSRLFGKIRSNTGFCIHSNIQPDKKVALQMCRPHMYEEVMVWSLDHKGRIRHAELCLEMTKDGTVRQEVCAQNKKEQLWSYSKEGLIMSTVSVDQCLIHEFSDEDPSKHTLGVVPCVNSDRAQLWSFIKY